MAKLTKTERKEYKRLKKCFKFCWKNAVDIEWDYFGGITELFWTPFPGANPLFTRSMCSENDIDNKKRGKLECLRKVDAGIWLPVY